MIRTRNENSHVMDDTNEVVDSSEDEISESEYEVCRIYDGEEPLDDFLEINRPSQLSISDATWIAVHFEQDDEEQDDEEQDDEEQDDEEQDDEEQDEEIHRFVQENEGKQKPDEPDKQADEERNDELRMSLLVQEQQEIDGEDKRQVVEQEQQNKQQEREPPDTNTEQSKCNEQEGELKDVKELPQRLLHRMIRKEWKYLLENKHDKMVIRETLKELALKYGYTSGKWMIFSSSKYIDDLWFTIAKAVVAGKLGTSTKVSTKNPKENTHVICVYTEDFTDEDDVTRMEKALRNLGIYRNMSYKADIYTILGIYKNNDLGIAPTIFKSEAVKNPAGVQQVNCMSYDGKEDLDSFLKRNKPSLVNGRDAPWISVSYQHHDHQYCRDMVLIEAEWKELQNQKGIKRFGAEFLKDLAVKYRYTSGKWMIFTSRYEVDDLWFSVAKAAIAGRLGNEAKVSTKKPNEDHVIYVYTKDFTYEPDVRRVERSLRNAGIRTRMSYKPDIYTSLGISAKNKLGISPTIFTSKSYDHRSRYRH